MITLVVKHDVFFWFCFYLMVFVVWKRRCVLCHTCDTYYVQKIFFSHSTSSSEWLKNNIFFWLGSTDDVFQEKSGVIRKEKGLGLSTLFYLRRSTRYPPKKKDRPGPADSWAQRRGKHYVVVCVLPPDKTMKFWNILVNHNILNKNTTSTTTTTTIRCHAPLVRDFLDL